MRVGTSIKKELIGGALRPAPNTNPSHLGLFHHRLEEGEVG